MFLLSTPTIASAETPSWVPNLKGLDDVPVENRDQVACVALAIYYEARGEKPKGQQAVGSVVMNRSRDKRYPATPCGVLFQRKQFSFIKGKEVPLQPKNDSLWKNIVSMASKIVSGELPDVSNGRLGFYNPKYASRRVRGIRIGNHVFHF